MRPAPGAASAGFLLSGEDEAARKERLEALVTERLDAASAAFDVDRISAREANPSELATLLETPPLLGSVRVVVLQEAESASADVERVIGAFLENPSPTTCLIALSSQKLTGEPWSSLRRAGREETFDPPRGPAELKALIKREVERAGKQIAQPAAALLAELNSDGAAALRREVEKVLTYVGERARVEVADVEAVAISSATGNRYTFLDLVGMGRRAEAISELHALLESGESPIYLVTLLVQHFLVLGGIRACEARGVRAPEALARTLGKPAWIFTKRNFRIRGYESPLEQARRFDREAIDRWLAGLIELDLALKSSRLPPAALMEEYVLRLMSITAAAA